MNLPIKKASVKTERLTLKPYSQSDKERLIGLITNSEITKSFMVPDFETAGQAAALAEKLIAFSQPEDVSHLEYGIYLSGVLHKCLYYEICF